MQVLIFASLFSVGLAQVAPIFVVNRPSQPGGLPMAPDLQVNGQAQTPLGNVNLNGEATLLGPIQDPNRPQGFAQVQGQGNLGPINGQTNGQLTPNQINAQGTIQSLPPPMNGQMPQIQPPEQLPLPIQPVPVAVRQFGDNQDNGPMGAVGQSFRGPVITGQPRQNPLSCGFSCSRQSTLMMNLDREFSSAACSGSGIERCTNCCHSIALANGIEKTWASGFISTNGRDCICCINKQRC